MFETTAPRNSVAMVIGVVMAVEALSFFLGALLHLGVRIPLGFATLAEPVIPPAVIVESLAGIGLAVGAIAVLTRQSWAWLASLAAHLFASAGVMLGIIAILASRGPSTPLNDTYHRVILIALLAGLALLVSPIGRRALGQSATQSLDDGKPA